MLQPYRHATTVSRAIPVLTPTRYRRNVHDPLTGRTAIGARKMAVSLLTYANRAKVAEALTRAGYPVTRVTVSRWAAGGEMPTISARMIGELFGHETPKEAAPQTEERLEAAVLRLEELLSGDGLEAVVARLEARLGLPRSPSDEDPPAVSE
jgi:hypothetical protein